MSDLDAMHYGKTGKNHNGRKDKSVQSDATEDEVTIPGDADLWEKLK